MAERKFFFSPTSEGGRGSACKGGGESGGRWRDGAAEKGERGEEENRKSSSQNVDTWLNSDEKGEVTESYHPDIDKQRSNAYTQQEETATEPKRKQPQPKQSDNHKGRIKRGRTPKLGVKVSHTPTFLALCPVAQAPPVQKKKKDKNENKQKNRNDLRHTKENRKKKDYNNDRQTPLYTIFPPHSF